MDEYHKALNSLVTIRNCGLGQLKILENCHKGSAQLTEKDVKHLLMAAKTVTQKSEELLDWVMGLEKRSSIDESRVPEYQSMEDQERHAFFMFHPTCVLLIDDEKSFLQSLSPLLQGAYSLVAAESPEQAREVLNSTINVSMSLAKDDSSGLLSNTTLTVGNQAALQKAYSPHRFSQISVVISDYSMPEEDGITFFRSIKHLPVMKVLITANPDSQLAIAAFNSGVIDAYIFKHAAEFPKLLSAKITLLQQQYFERLSKKIAYMLPEVTRGLLHHPTFQNLFHQVLQDTRAVEYYLVDMQGSYVFIDDNGIVSWLLIRDESDLAQMNTILHGSSETVGKSSTSQPVILISEEDGLPINVGKRGPHPANQLSEGLYYTVISEENSANWVVSFRSSQNT